MLAHSNPEIESIEVVLKALMHMLGFGTSESDSESFATALYEAADAELTDIAESHDEGLCLYSIPGLAQKLYDSRPQHEDTSS